MKVEAAAPAKVAAPSVLGGALGRLQPRLARRSGLNTRPALAALSGCGALLLGPRISLGQRRSLLSVQRGFCLGRAAVGSSLCALGAKVVWLLGPAAVLARQ
jgi:hypothetical protein